MRIAWISAGVMALLSPAWGADVVAYVGARAATTPYPAMKMASALFESAGVTLKWRPPKDVRKDTAGKWLRIELSQDAQEQSVLGALALSYPFDQSGRGITVFLDRIRSEARDPVRESKLLAYVLVHEITHVIQHADVHTAQGIMKAHWDAPDRAAIYSGTLSFSPADVTLIQQGLSIDWRRPRALLNVSPQSEIAVHPE